jgi:hypothetical protein
MLWAGNAKPGDAEGSMSVYLAGFVTLYDHHPVYDALC